MRSGPRRRALRLFLPVGLSVLVGCSGSESPSPSSTGTDSGTTTSPSPSSSTSRLTSADIAYLGAFRLPGGDERPNTFAYGGNGIAYCPIGDPSGGGDGFPGSLIVMGHDRMPYGELPDGGRVAEVSIPAPTRAGAINALPRAAMLQDFRDVVGDMFDGLDEIPRTGMVFLDVPQTGPRVHVTWGQHFQEDPRPSHGFFGLDLGAPSPQGAWYLADAPLYGVNGYLFEIPSTWAQANAQGRVIATGRYRDGGWSGKGPTLYAYRPWNDSGGLPGRGGSVPNTLLLRYESSQVNGHIRTNAMSDYQHADEWEGGAFITTSGGKSAVAFVGTKGTGAKHWYGWINGDGPSIPCIETDLLGQYTLCWRSDGTPCPDSDLGGCADHASGRGWWSSSFAAQMVLYDPDDLARVAAGVAEPHAPQPYEVVDIDGHLFHNPSNVDPETNGRGVQQRFRIGATTYDREHGRLYMLELFADGAKPVVHVFGIQ